MKKMLLALVLSTSCILHAHAIDKNSFSYDFAINLSRKAGFGALLSFHYFIADGLSADFHIGGFPGGSFGIGTSISYFPAPGFPYFYLTPGVSYISEGGDNVEGNDISISSSAVFLNLGLTSPFFRMGNLWQLSSDIELQTVVFLEAGVARFLHAKRRINGIIDFEGNNYFGKKWHYPNIEIGIRQEAKNN